MRCRYPNEPLLFSAVMIFMLGCVSPLRTTINSNVVPTPTPTVTPTPGVPATPSPTATPMSVQLSAGGKIVISGVEADLRGNFEQRSGQTSLGGQIENVNMPVGSAVSFCLMHEGQTIPLAVGITRLQDQGRVAEFHLRTDQGQNPPRVQVGDVLQARDGANVTLADCSRPLLVAGAFVLNNSSGGGS